MREDYTQHSDEELLIRLRDGEQGITDHIMNKYKNLVRKKAKSMYILGADNDDLIQEGMIGLFKESGITMWGEMPVSTLLQTCVSRGRCTMRCRHRAGKTCTAQYIYFAVCRYDRGGG